MPVTIPATKAHRQFGELVRRVYSGEQHFIVERDGLPVAVIMSMPEYKELVRERERREEKLKPFREAAREIGDEFERQGLSEEEIEDQVEAVRERLYRERRHGHSTT